MADLANMDALRFANALTMILPLLWERVGGRGTYPGVITRSESYLRPSPQAPRLSDGHPDGPRLRNPSSSVPRPRPRPLAERPPPVHRNQQSVETPEPR